MDAKLQAIYDGILNGNQKVVPVKVTEALDAGVEPAVVLNDSMVAAMAEVGRLFEQGEYYVPEMLIAARAMQAGIGLLKPLLVQAGSKPRGKVVIGTVKGDLHDIGKNLVALMLQGSGFEVVDLGADVKPERFVDAVKTSQPHFVMMSALLTTTMLAMKDTVEALKAANLRSQVKVAVGGAPVTQRFCEEIGADFYSANATGAVTKAKELLPA